MKRFLVLITAFFVSNYYSQITVINTGTSEDLYSITNLGQNYLISGWNSFLAKCNGDCNNIKNLTVPSFPNLNYSFKISRPDTNYLFLTASSYQNLNLTLWKSSDGGYNWVKKIDTVGGSTFEGSTVFFDTLNGACYTDNFKTLTSTNGLTTYSVEPWYSYMPVLAEGFGDSSLALVSCGGNCGLNISKDRGKSWLYSSGAGGVYLYDVKFLNTDTIFAISAKSSQSSCSYIFRSFDGGYNFDYKTFCGVPYGVAPPSELLISLCPKSRNEIYITARDGYSSGYYTGNGIILKSTDLGQNWTRFVTPFHKNLNSMKFLNDSIALVCGEGGLLFKWNTKTAVFTSIEENIFKEHSITIYPNPASDKLIIKCEVLDPEKISVNISDFLGQIVYLLNGLSQCQELDISFLPQGVYFINLKNHLGQRTYKIIKE